MIFISASLAKGVHIAKDGFSTRRIQSLDGWVKEDLSDEAKGALKQSFRYVGRGRQCFAFASEDGKYILKFPRTDIYKTPFWAQVLPVAPYRQTLEARHKAREDFILESFRLSYNELKNQTALLAIHLGKSHCKDKLTVYDKMGSKYLLSLGSTSFVLQYKQPILMQQFQQAMTRGELQEAKKILDSLLIVVVERARKGILNRDRSFLRNYGFDGEKAYQIDVGSFFKNPALTPEASYQKSVRDSIDPVQEWLSLNSPEMLEYINEKLEEFI